MISQAMIDALDQIYTADPMSYGIYAGEYQVWSVLLHRMFTGQTLTIARTQRSEAERVYREHHAKND